ncbi:hypothetical protein OGAPHI_001152 [Ogataea philodendri]|uniref:Uncharacterized protein n=1 Tax=Ogataea philodendri TaxID=1378263 RepID=A0A9P8PEP1_9ASCO|nr:uncharacterized protein OGAPHI_001152 [Ogataea philodendri]KAH3670637.1 hypothetical protein OGAPHI_001152 [Ogataea philodendri]
MSDVGSDRNSSAVKAGSNWPCDAINAILTYLSSTPGNASFRSLTACSDALSGRLGIGGGAVSSAGVSVAGLATGSGVFEEVSLIE